jgi:hypothetical protein
VGNRMKKVLAMVILSLVAVMALAPLALAAEE